MTEAAPGAQELDDAELLNMVRAGDSTAFGTLYQRHAGAARRMARDLAGPPAEVEEVVAETFANVLELIKHGGGPTDAFRPYVLTALRRVCYDRLRLQRAQVPADDQQMPDQGDSFIDPVAAGPDNSLIVRAFLSLPERWSAVLWHTEIEQASPAEVAPLLGLTRDGVATLKHRALEGLRQAYLQMYISHLAPPECRPVAERLGGYLRETLSESDASMVAEHLSDCDECRAVCAELSDMNTALRVVVAPAFLGRAAASYLSGAEYETAAAPAGTSAGTGAAAAIGAQTLALPAADGTSAGAETGKPHKPRPGRRLRHAPGQPHWFALGAGAVISAIAIGAFAITLAGHDTALRPPAHGQRAKAGKSGSVGNVVQSQQPSQSAKTPGRTHSAAPTPSNSSGPGTTPATTTPPPTVSPSRPPSTSPSPSPSPTPSVQLAATIDVYTYGQGNFAQVVFQVTDTGTAGTGELTGSITLPPGTTLFGGWHGGHSEHGGHGGQGGWTCQASASGASCQHDAISAGAQAQGTLWIGINGTAACGQPVSVTVTSGSASASAQSPETIQCQS